MKRVFSETTLKSLFVVCFTFVGAMGFLAAQDGLPYRIKGATTTPLSMNWSAVGSWQANTAPAGNPVVWVDATQIPNATNSVQIRSNHNVTIDIPSAACLSVSFSGSSASSSLTIPTGNTLAVADVINVQEPTSNANRVTVQGNLAAMDIDLKGLADAAKLAELVIDGGTVAVTADIKALGTSSKITFMNGGVINVGKNFMSGLALGTLTAGTGTINLAGTGLQNLGGYTYNNIDVTGTGTLTFLGPSTTIAGTFANTTNNTSVKMRSNLTVLGTFNAGTGTYTFESASPNTNLRPGRSTARSSR